MTYFIDTMSRYTVTDVDRDIAARAATRIECQITASTTDREISDAARLVANPMLDELGIQWGTWRSEAIIRTAATMLHNRRDELTQR